ncbi:restriction endonuclease subunit S [Adhaeribacter radiodurans]|uniref:Restriction endonuclease subunit S n=2 Tax=Adhaeribacter radiodurans TaxID=2745197 RepID=A0A7L7LAV8_9BACT|nr:restriction endonuclease subunit S [Adhaeribacter radiodurans]
MQPKKDIAFPSFLAYNFITSNTRNKFIKRGKTTTMTTIGQEDIASVEINIPSLLEQQKIASFLSAVDEKLQALKKKKSLLEQYKKGVMQKIFFQEIRFKDDNGKDFPDWEEKLVGEVIEFINGKAHENDIDINGKYIVVNSKFVSTEGRIKKFSNKQILSLFKNDIVLVMSDVPNGKALAKCYLIDNDNTYTLNQRICALREDKCNNAFLIYLINRNDYYLSFDSGVGQTNLRKEDVLNCPLIIPSSLVKQTKIADFLSAIDAKINHCQTQIVKTEQFKKGLLQQMFC